MGAALEIKHKHKTGPIPSDTHGSMCTRKRVLMGLLLAYTIAEVTSNDSNEPACDNPSSFFLGTQSEKGVCSIDSYEEEERRGCSVTGTLVIHLGKFEKREATFVFEEQQGKESACVRYSGNLLDDDVSLELNISHPQGKRTGFAVTGHTVINDEKNSVDVSAAEKKFRVCHGDSCLMAEYEAEESSLQFEVPSGGQVKSWSLQKLVRVFLKGKRFFGTAQWRDICKQFAEDERGCSGQLNAVFQNITWSFQRESETLKDSHKLRFSLSRGGTFSAKGHFSSITAANETRMELKFSIPKFVDLTMNVSSVNSVWKVQLIGIHPLLQYKLDSFSEFAATDAGVGLRHRTTLSNLTSSIASYQLGFSKHGPEMDIRHNLTSELYSFESNMTVTQLADHLVKTLITQRAVSPIWDFLNFSLKQVFFSQGDTNWETVVMKNVITNMHVTGTWIGSIFNFYDKTFQFLSKDENIFPSMNVRLDYSEFSHFKNIFHFPLLARKLDATLTLNKTQLFPLTFMLNDLDEFEPVESNLIDFEITQKVDDYQAFCDVNVEQLEDRLAPAVEKLKKVFSPLRKFMARFDGLNQLPELQLLADVWNLLVPQQSITLHDISL